jgi:hypothetical protein
MGKQASQHQMETLPVVGVMLTIPRKGDPSVSDSLLITNGRGT